MVWFTVRKHNPLPPASVIKEISFTYQTPNGEEKFEGIIPLGKYKEFLSLFDDAVYNLRNSIRFKPPGVCNIKKKDGTETQVRIYGTVDSSDERTIIGFQGNYFKVANDKKFYSFFKNNNQKSHQPKNSGTFFEDDKIMY